jgi:hypothetical protein
MITLKKSNLGNPNIFSTSVNGYSTEEQVVTCGNNQDSQFIAIGDGPQNFTTSINGVTWNINSTGPFNISGKNSIIKDIQFESQIFSDQATIIAISAQSDAGKLGLENSSMVAFNRGIKDRMISKKDSPISSQKDSIEQSERR